MRMPSKINENKELENNPPTKVLTPVNVTDIKSAKRLLARIIKSYQLGEIDDRTAKTVAYLVQVMSSLIKDHEIEDRIKQLEEKVLTK